MASRTHLYYPIVDEAGDLRRYAKVRIYLEDGKTPYKGKIFRDRQSLRTYSNPWIVSPALVSIYLPEAMRVVLGIATDQSKPEVLSEVLDVTFDGAMAVSTVTPMFVDGASTPSALLESSDADSSFWHPLRVDHEHAGVAPDTLLAGKTPRSLAQAAAFTGSTVLGAQAGDRSARSTLRDSTMLGLASWAHGRGATALGRAAYAAESPATPWSDGAVSVGSAADSEAEGVALGARSDAGAAVAGQQVALGRGSSGSGVRATSLGRGSRAAVDGVAIGSSTGSSSNGPTGSIGIGAGAQYGLPGDQDDTHDAVMLGAHDPANRLAFPWSNPGASQSESPLDEFTENMRFASRTVQFQRHLAWLVNAVALKVGGDATLGASSGLLGFYGATPKAKQSLGEDEPSSGIPALDNLIYALRELGLIRYRTEATVTYRAEDMSTAYREMDLVPRWDEHFGIESARSSGGMHPRFEAYSDTLHGYPTVYFDNSIYRRTTKPVQEMQGSTLLARAKHYLMVADHTGTEFGYYEGAFNLTGGQVVGEDATIFTSDTVGSTTWRMPNASRYAMDGLDQTANRSAGLPLPHVYRMTHRDTWPHARAVIGGPRTQDATNTGDRFTGAITEIVGMDDTWDEAQVRSLTTGLMFKYGIGQNKNALENPAKDFILTQHDPYGGTFVFWKEDYSDNFTGRVYGRAVNVPKPVVFIPFISIFLWFDIFSFRGSLLGNWGNINFSFNYEVEVSVVVGDFDNDGDFDARVDVDVEFNSSIEVNVGRFALNNNLTWSMGQLSSRVGHKVCRIRHRTTRQVICVSGSPPFRYADTEVRVYSTKPDGSLLLEGTSPLWGDGTFGVRVKNPGHKVARVYEVSTGALLGTTEYHEKALPRTTIVATDDPDYSLARRDRAESYTAALTALAILDMDTPHRYRARHVLKTLALVVNDDGSLNEVYSSALPAKLGGQPTSVRAALWTIVAALRYQEETGDPQFLLFARKLADWAATQTIPLTADRAVAYFAFRDLAIATSVASYASTAQTLRTGLLTDNWDSAADRWSEAASGDAEALAADTLGGLFLLAIGDRAKARATIKHLKRYRVKGAQISAPHYSGPNALIGYKPFAELGSTPYPNPPSVIDQQGSWLAVLFKLRFGEPVGDDVSSLMRWQATTILGPNATGLHGAQFLSHNANALAAPYGLRARPHLGSATWAYLMAKGGRTLFAPDPLPAPSPTGLSVTSSYDRASYRAVFRYAWTVDPAVLCAAFEAVPEFSINAGQSWSPVAPNTITGQTENVRDRTVGSNGYAATWSVPVPENLATVYRVRLRLRNAAFGPWITSAQATLPAIT